MRVQKHARAKFDESVEVAMNLGIDTRRGDSQVCDPVLWLAGCHKRRLSSAISQSVLLHDKPTSCATSSSNPHSVASAPRCGWQSMHVMGMAS